MNTATQTAAIALMLLIAAIHSSCIATEDPDNRIDYQKVLNKTPWRLDPNEATLLRCALARRGRYAVRLTFPSDHGINIRIAILDGDVLKYEWTGYTNTVFDIYGDALYYISQVPRGVIRKVDLRDGRVVWESPVTRGQDPHFVSGFESAVMILSAGESTLSIAGEDSSGRYREFKRTDTGESLAHRLYPADAVPLPEKP